jgi:ribosomal protein L10
MSKVVKALEYADIEKSFAGVRDLILVAPNKVDSALDYNFRKSLREKKVRAKMVKNTLARKVLEAQGITLDPKVWSGTTIVCWGGDSVKDLSKAVDTFIKETEKKDPKAKDKLTVKVAVADGQPVPLDVALKMPTRLEAIGEIVAMILGPASEIASALTGPAGQVASQIAQISEGKAGPEATPAA